MSDLDDAGTAMYEEYLEDDGTVIHEEYLDDAGTVMYEEYLDDAFGKLANPQSMKNR
jgi:hypothetical protein